MTDWNLLAKYLDDECSPAEADAVRRWSAADPAHAAELELLRRAWRRAAELPSAPRVEALWERIAHSAGLLGAEPALVHSQPAPAAAVAPAAPRRRPRHAGSGWMHGGRRWDSAAVTVGLAATLVFAVGVALARTKIIQLGRPQVAAADTATREYRTARGQRATILLADGTRVTLGVESRLRVAAMAAAPGTPRVAYLDGEALFEVAHLPSQPFLVHAGGAVAQDIGTTFGVRAYEDEPVRVVVVEGSVALRDSAPNGRETVLGANDVARLATGTLEVERGIDPRPYVAWSDGRLVFRQTRLATVATQLERVYDVRIAIPDSALRESRVSASFRDQEGLDAVLHALAETLDASVQRQGADVVVRPKR